MFARITHYTFNTDKTDEMVARMEEIKPRVKAVAGAKSVQTCWRDDGTGVTIAIYESQAAADAAVPQVQKIWGELAEFLTSPPKMEGYQNVENLTG